MQDIQAQIKRDLGRKISYDMLEKRNACKTGLNWFIREFGRKGRPTLSVLMQRVVKKPFVSVIERLSNNRKSIKFEFIGY